MCSIQSILLGTRDMTLPSPQEVHHLATKTRETQNYHKSALFIVNLHTSGTNGECIAMLLPPALVTFFSSGLRGLPICNKTMAFECFPFPRSLNFPPPQIFQLPDSPSDYTHPHPFQTRGFPTTPLRVLLSVLRHKEVGLGDCIFCL